MVADLFLCHGRPECVYTDYAVRVLIGLILQSDRLATIADISKGHNISQNHLMEWFVSLELPD